MTEDMFKLNATEHVAQRQRYNKTTRLRNHDTSEEIVCGRMAPGTCNRTRGFSVRYDKRIATESGASIRTNVERRRTSNDTSQMTATRDHGVDELTSQRETSRYCFLDSRKYSRIYNGENAKLSLVEFGGGVSL